MDRLVTGSGGITAEARAEYLLLRGAVAEAMEDHAEELERAGYAGAARLRRLEVAEYHQWAQQQKAATARAPQRSSRRASVPAARTGD
jgi:hypothetical protein